MQDSDGHLLSRFAAHHDEAAFRELTARHLGLIYHVALRRTGNRQMAEEVSQNVLCAVVRKAARLAKHPDRLSAWLHRAAIFESSKAMRAEASHQRRKQLFHPDEISSTANEASVWSSTLPLLDLALDRLPDSDRNLVLAHYFERKSFIQIGAHTGRPAPTVQKQCRRALEKLARILRGKGVMLSAGALATGLATFPAKAAPAALLKSASGLALTNASTFSTTSLTWFMATKSKAALPVALLVLLSPLALQELAISRATARNEQLRDHHSPREQTASRTPDRTRPQAASTGERKITLELLLSTFQKSKRYGEQQIEVNAMIATLDAEELEGMIPRALTMSGQGQEGRSVAYFLTRALAKLNPERAVKAACEPELTSLSQSTVVRQALFEWASASPEKAIGWLNDLAGRHRDATGHDLLPFRSDITRALILADHPRARDLLVKVGDVSPLDIVNSAVLSNPLDSARLRDPLNPTLAEDPDVITDRFFKFLPWIREFLPEHSTQESSYNDRYRTISELLLAYTQWKDPVVTKVMERDGLAPAERSFIAKQHTLKILAIPYDTSPNPEWEKMETIARDWLTQHIPENADEIFEESAVIARRRGADSREGVLRSLEQQEKVRDEEITHLVDGYDLSLFPEMLPRAIKQAGRINDPAKRAAALDKLQSILPTEKQ